MAAFAKEQIIEQHIDVANIPADIPKGASLRDGLSSAYLGFQHRRLLDSSETTKIDTFYRNFRRCYEYYNFPHSTSRRILIHFDRIAQAGVPGWFCYHSLISFISRRNDPWKPSEIEACLDKISCILRVCQHFHIIEWANATRRRPRIPGYDIAVTQLRARKSFGDPKEPKRGQAEGVNRRGQGAKTKNYRKKDEGETVFWMENRVGGFRLRDKYGCKDWRESVHLPAFDVFGRESRFCLISIRQWKRIIPDKKRRRRLRRYFKKYGRLNLWKCKFLFKREELQLKKCLRLVPIESVLNQFRFGTLKLVSSNNASSPNPNIQKSLAGGSC